MSSESKAKCWDQKKETGPTTSSPEFDTKNMINRSKMRLHHSTLITLLCFIYLTKQEEVGDCKREKIGEVNEGKSFSLVSHMEAFQTCYFVFKQYNSSVRCCYGPRETCESANQTHNERCHGHNTKVDSRDTHTCNLSIANVKKEDSGFYKVFNGDSELITKCHLIVTVPQLNYWMLASAILSVALCISVVTLAYLLKTQKGSHNCDAQKSYKHAPESILMVDETEKNHDQLIQSDSITC